jgi:hypothetical protein
MLIDCNHTSRRHVKVNCAFHRHLADGQSSRILGDNWHEQNRECSRVSDGSTEALVPDHSSLSLKEDGDPSQSPVIVANLPLLGMLRERNEQGRRSSLVQPAASHRSVEMSTSSLLTPAESLTFWNSSRNNFPHLDETSVETDPSLNWDFVSATPVREQSVKRHASDPLLLQQRKHIASSRKNLDLELTHYYERLRVENVLYRGHIRLLEKHHNSMMHRDRVMLRREIQNRVKAAARRRLRVATVLFVVFCLVHAVLQRELRSTLLIFNRLRFGAVMIPGENILPMACVAQNAFASTCMMDCSQNGTAACGRMVEVTSGKANLHQHREKSFRSSDT